ncbi:CHAT domain-containing protein [Micromonospora rubida]|uniref:CHAT domain-containing protein n=1 Tax=Micromonospora rubida TaxID=2697657 RepID=UPI001377D928|nr:CHAT domain-containing protein [Micromonospora rubida]NBE84919.1 CHAT domain-containing protein [Micromonospora rubida]
MHEDTEKELRARLTRLTGAARTRPLLELFQILADRYWRAGPGRPAALPALDEAIDCLAEAYGHLRPGDPMRAQAAGHLGWFLGTRQIAHGGPESDRPRAIGLLEEALAATNLPPMFTFIARLTLGQLHLTSVVRGFQSLDMSTLLAGTGHRPDLTEADRAIDCFQQVLAGHLLSTEMAEGTQAMLTCAETVRDLFVGLDAGTGIDFEPMMRAMATLQEVQRRTADGVNAGTMPRLPNLLGGRSTATVDTLDFPVTVLHGPEPVLLHGPEPVPGAGDRVRPSAAPVDPAALRRALRERVAGGGDPHAALAALLRPDAPPPPAGLVDDLVGLATSVTHAAGATATAADRIVLAVALYLRGRDDADDGWGDADDDAGAAAVALSAAADALPADPSGAVPLAVDLARLLDGRNPEGRVCDALHDRFAPVAQALRGVRVQALAWPRPDGTRLLLHTDDGRFRDGRPDGALPPRVVVVGTEPLPDDDAVISHVTSARQAGELAGRVPLRVTEAPVLVVDPRGGHDEASLVRLCRRLYPRAVVLGRADGGSDGPGTPEEVRRRLDASMLHLTCGVSATGTLELAGSTDLDIAAITGRTTRTATEGGLVVLPPTGSGSGPLAEAFLAAGFTGVVGWARPVPRPVATLMLAVLHTGLVRGGLRPAAAVRSVRRWLASPDRRTPAGLAPAPMDVTGPALADPGYRSAMVYHGI